MATCINSSLGPREIRFGVNPSTAFLVIEFLRLHYESASTWTLTRAGESCGRAPRGRGAMPIFLIGLINRSKNGASRRPSFRNFSEAEVQRFAVGRSIRAG